MMRGCLLGVVVVSAACSQSSSARTGDGGGQTAVVPTGGGVGGGVGGNASGGKPGAGGNVGSGGEGGNASGGGNGGNAAGGGNASGGSNGSNAGGGNLGSGGVSASGGASGEKATGGSAGGNSARGGSASGGASTAASSGGSGAAGGAQATGGAGGDAGGGSNYPTAGASGQAKPTGSGTTVTVLDWAGFKRAVSFTFDDANESQLDNYKTLQALNDKANNVRYTFYLWTEQPSADDPMWGQIHRDGHELGNHSKTHSPPGTVQDLQAAEDFIQAKFGVHAYTEAAPGDDSSYISVAQNTKAFLMNRMADSRGGGVSPTDDPGARQWQIPCDSPAGDGPPASSMIPELSSALSGGKWITFLSHGFKGSNDNAYHPLDINEFVKLVQWAKDQGDIWIDTAENAAAYWIAQYRFNHLTPVTTGTDKTWTWKVSDFNTPFPSGKYLRVRTNGGTLKQGSTVLAWNDHGYYEVSLDAGTLTLSQ
jgi:hypothetical protein